MIFILTLCELEIKKKLLWKTEKLISSMSFFIEADNYNDAMIETDFFLKEEQEQCRYSQHECKVCR